MRWKAVVRSIARRMGVIIEAPPPGLVDFLTSREITVVFDVGANAGQFGQYLRKNGYRGRIVSFEPVHQVFEQLQAAARGDPDWLVHNCGLGAKAGWATIHVSASTDFSSILEQRHAAVEHAAQSVAVGSERVAMRTLDEFAWAFADENCFLKIDTQGFERQVIAGATQALASLRGVQMELPIIHLYVGVWTFSQAVDHMAEKGFIISQIDPVSYHSRDRCAVIELDCVFRRRSDLD